MSYKSFVKIKFGNYQADQAQGNFDSGYTNLIEEVPCAISINGINHAIMLVTPCQLDDFVVGFAFSEGIIKALSDLRDIEIQPILHKEQLTGFTAELNISARRFAQYKQSNRARLGTTGCGLCGIESLELAFPKLSKLAPHSEFPNTRLSELKSTLRAHQTLGHQAGAIHGALLLSTTGHPLICMEDIGRHNALDKIIGYALRNSLSLTECSVVMTSRCSAELVQKAVKAQLSRLIHLASPSTLAVKLARDYGLTLIHIPRHDKPRVFTTSPIQSERV